MTERDENQEDPKLETPAKTAVDDFLSVSTKKVAKVFKKRPFSHSSGSMNDKSASAGRSSSALPLVSSNLKNKSVDIGKQSFVPLVSPLQISSVSKPKMNRKTLNKLKRKRLEENTTYFHINISFSTNLIPCFFQPISAEARMVMNSLRLGTLFAKEIIALDPTFFMRWPLLNDQSEIESRKEITSNKMLPKEDTSPSSRDFNGILNSSKNHNPSFILSTDDDIISKPPMSIESIANMTKAMNAGILFAGSNNYQYLMVPHEISGTLMGLACVWDNVSQVQQHDMDQCRAAGIESQHADISHAPMKKMSKFSKFDTEVDLSACENSIEDVDEIMHEPRGSEFEPLLWSDLLLQYNNCIAQDEGAPSPIIFATHHFRIAITTFWNKCKGQGSRSEDIQDLINLLRQPIDDGDKGVRLLQSQSELAVMLKARPKESFNDRNPNLGGDQVPPKHNEFVTLIIVQILMRIQLFAMHTDNDTDRKIFLQTFSVVDLKDVPAKKSKKKRKKQKPYTLQNFTSEICSLAEKLSFILPSPGSFAAFFNEQVLKPFLLIAPDLISDMAAFFELDLSHYEDGIEATLYDEDGESDQAIVDGIHPSSPGRNSNSRWFEKTILPKEMGLAANDVPLSATEKSLKLPETEDKILFKNKMDLTVKINRANPLLADSKGRYIGRQFSSNYFREVKVTKSLLVTKKKSPAQSDQTPEKQSPESFLTRVSETPQEKPRRTMSLGLATSIGASSASFRKATSRRSDMFGNSTKSKSSTDMPPPKGRHPHAGVLAALAAMRKKR
jgi:hypothetical protein|eukprot:scaffold1264_cov263-Chaetoceros_neogracile.AAC.8